MNLPRFATVCQASIVLLALILAATSHSPPQLNAAPVPAEVKARCRTCQCIYLVGFAWVNGLEQNGVTWWTGFVKQAGTELIAVESAEPSIKGSLLACHDVDPAEVTTLPRDDYFRQKYSHGSLRSTEPDDNDIVRASNFDGPIGLPYGSLGGTTPFIQHSCLPTSVDTPVPE